MSNITNRNDDIVKMKEAGNTQQEIAKKYGISRQRVQQIEKSLGLDRQKEEVIYSYKCVECKKSFDSKSPNRVYCSRGCSSEGRKVCRTQEEIEVYNDKKREQLRIRSHNYYRKIKLGK